MKFVDYRTKVNFPILLLRCCILAQCCEVWWALRIRLVNGLTLEEPCFCVYVFAALDVLTNMCRRRGVSKTSCL